MQFTVPAQYAPYVADVVARAVRDVTLDAEFRADSDPRVQQLGAVPDALIDRNAPAHALVEVVVPCAAPSPL
jgi:hypothetical protein